MSKIIVNSASEIKQKLFGDNYTEQVGQVEFNFPLKVSMLESFKKPLQISRGFFNQGLIIDQIASNTCVYSIVLTQITDETKTTNGLTFQDINSLLKAYKAFCPEPYQKSPALISSALVLKNCNKILVSPDDDYDFINFFRVIILDNTQLSFVCKKHDKKTLRTFVFHGSHDAQLDFGVFQRTHYHLYISGLNLYKKDYASEVCLAENYSFGSTNCKIHGSLKFTGAPSRFAFENCRFNRPIDISTLKTPADTLFKNCTFHGHEHSGSEALYRTLRTKMMEIGSEKMAQEFAAHEQKAHYFNLKRNLKNKLWQPTLWIEITASWLLNIINQYGRSLALPLLWLFGLAIIFFSVYCHYKGIGIQEPVKPWAKNLTLVEQSAVYAGAYFFGPLGLFVNSSGLEPQTLLMRSVAFFHGIFSTILWFLFITNLRRRFKL